MSHQAPHSRSDETLSTPASANTSSSGLSSLRPDIIAFSLCYISLIGAAIALLTIISAVVSLQL
jgi:hypothetical protein